MTHEELARKSAEILGASSAAALAVQELDRRRSAGEDVEIISYLRRWIVGPRAAISRATGAVTHERK